MSEVLTYSHLIENCLVVLFVEVDNFRCELVPSHNMEGLMHSTVGPASDLLADPIISHNQTLMSWSLLYIQKTRLLVGNLSLVFQLLHLDNINKCLLQEILFSCNQSVRTLTSTTSSEQISRLWQRFTIKVWVQIFKLAQSSLSRGKVLLDAA